MILVTVGTQKFQFNRLLEAVDRLAEDRVIRESVLAQVGCSTYVPRNFRAVDFLKKEEMDAAMESCSLLITHSGVGTILAGLRAGKKIIVVPRKKAFGEHVDDHQEQIAAKFEEMGYVRVCREIGELGSCYAGMEDFPCRRLEPDFSKTAKLINGYLDTIEDEENKPWPKK